MLSKRRADPTAMRRMLVTLAAAVVLVSPAGSVAHTKTGYYLKGKGATKNTVFTWDGVVADPETGLPKVRYGSEAYWNVVTLSLYGLQEMNIFLTTGKRKHLREAQRAGDWLVTNQRRDGTWRYEFAFTYSGFSGMAIQPGWVAAQAQGNAISLLVRLYRHAEKPRFLKSARRAVRPYRRSWQENGIRRKFRGRTLYEGFPTPTPSFTLEDFELALLGLWDLSRYDGRAPRLFRKGAKALAFAAPYYDEGGRPLYDLYWYYGGPRRHDSHEFNAMMFRLLGRYSGLPRLKRFARRWEASL